MPNIDRVIRTLAALQLEIVVRPIGRSYERSSVKWRYIVQPPWPLWGVGDADRRALSQKLLVGSMTVVSACARRINLYPAAP
jgi:hypothetical protein